MNFQGIDWAVPIYEVLVVVVSVYGYVAIRRRVQRKVLTKLRAFWYYAGLVISPVALYIIFFWCLVGFEEVFKTATISEGLARSVVILTGLGLAVWLISSIVFGIALTFVSDND